MKKIGFLLIILLPCTCILAQNSIDLLTIAGHYSAPGKYENNSTKKGKEHIWHMNLKLPLVRSEVNTWYSEISYYNFQVNGDLEAPSAIAHPVDLHGIIMQTGLIHRLNEDHALIMLFVPRLMGDLINIDNKSFQLGGIGLFEKRFHKSLVMRFGASYNQELFGPFIVPLVYLDWQLSDKWHITGLLPVYAKVSRFINKDLSVGFHYFGLVTTYRLGHENYANDYMERRSIDLSLFARRRIASNVHFEVRAGFALGRDYAQYDENDKIDFALPLVNFGDNRQQQNISFDGGPFIRGQLVYNLPINGMDRND